MHCLYCGKRIWFGRSRSSSGFCNSDHRLKYEESQGKRPSSKPTAPPPKGRIIDLRPDSKPSDIPQHFAEATIPADLPSNIRVGRGLAGASFRGILKHPIRRASAASSPKLAAATTTLGPLTYVRLELAILSTLKRASAESLAIDSADYHSSHAQPKLREKRIGTRGYIALRESPGCIQPAALPHEQQFLIPPEPFNHRSTSKGPGSFIRLGRSERRMRKSIPCPRVGLRIGSPEQSRLQAAESTSSVREQVEFLGFDKRSPYLLPTRLGLAHHIGFEGENFLDFERLTPALPTLGAPAAALTAQRRDWFPLRINASVLFLRNSTCSLSAASAHLHRTPNPQGILMEVPPSSIAFVAPARSPLPENTELSHKTFTCTLSPGRAHLYGIPNPRAILMELCPTSIAFAVPAPNSLPESPRFSRKTSKIPGLRINIPLASYHTQQRIEHVFKSRVDPLTFPPGATLARVHLAKASQLREEAMTSPRAISPAPNPPSFLDLRSRNGVILQPQFKRLTASLAGSVIHLPLPADSAHHILNVEAGYAVRTPQLAKPNSGASIWQTRLLKAATSLRAGTLAAVPLEPRAAPFNRIQAFSESVEVASVLRCNSFFLVSPNASMLDDRTRDLAERLLNPTILRLIQTCLPGNNLESTKPQMPNCVDCLPLDARWQRKRTLWDRGARWKSSSQASLFPPGKLPLPKL